MGYPEPLAEWLETDGLGGFSSGTVSGRRTRRYHAVLLPAVSPPSGRAALVDGFEAWVERANAGTGNGEREYLTTQRYEPDVTAPNGEERIISFTRDPWPAWTFRLDDGALVEQELFVPHGIPAVALRWRLIGAAVGCTLRVRPFLSGRDSHALHHENPAFRFDGELDGELVRWRPYDGLPAVLSLSNGRYASEPLWYRNFRYDEERARGLDATGDLATPGVLSWDLSKGPAVWLLSAESLPGGETLRESSATLLFDRLRAAEGLRRSRFLSSLHRAADAYLVRRGEGMTIIAGYPWFADWGRDTFIAMRGLCLSAGRWDDAKAILLQWSGAVSEGMLPNRFVEQGDQPEFNSVDAALWYVIAVHDLLRSMRAGGGRLTDDERAALEGAVEAILTGYAGGTRYGIGVDEDGLLRAGVPGVQLTWMDAKVGDWVVTPRIGKPVEVEALWLNALRVAGEIGQGDKARWSALFERGLASFRQRFWDEADGYLYDVVDAESNPGQLDRSLRPNQIFAVGGLPYSLLERAQARRVVDAVERRLLTPLGLRSLAQGEPGYSPRYQGGVLERDGSYHQGTVWPWLIGPFVEAWVKVRGSTTGAKQEARRRFVQPLLRHLEESGLGHVSEIADAEAPHTPRGCPFQAWSAGELLRLDQEVLAIPPARPVRRTRRVQPT